MTVTALRTFAGNSHRHVGQIRRKRRLHDTVEMSHELRHSHLQVICQVAVRTRTTQDATPSQRQPVHSRGQSQAAVNTAHTEWPGA